MKTTASIVLLCNLSLLLNAEPPAAKPQRTIIPAETLAKLDAHTGVTFARYGTREMQLDLYRPKEATKSLPAIICIHGGGWYKGDRTAMTNLAQALASKGFVATTISYRLSGEEKFPAAIQDCKAAVRFLRANAAKFGIDSSAIGVTGLSAGGHLAALLTTSGGIKELEGDGGNAEQSSAVQAGIAMGAQSDLESARIGELSSKTDDPFYRTFLGDAQSVIPKTYALASPRHHLDKKDPPLFFMAGELDDASTHADDTCVDLEKLGIPTGLKLIPAAPHAFLGQQKDFDLAVSTCVEFFSRHLVKATSP
ncbi:MAG: alpha/beta hydrolase [Verrucomicrobiaceae bacterium]|nr:alpha/beta hydrolase [Verrucomicrobiaceae bacterium]